MGAGNFISSASKGKEAVMQEYDDIIRKKGLPNVGQLVQSKKYNTIWRVMEKREV
jgi:hypothetical protein